MLPGSVGYLPDIDLFLAVLSKVLRDVFALHVGQDSREHRDLLVPITGTSIISALCTHSGYVVKMSRPKELDWKRLFAFDQPAVRPEKVSHECCAACREARDITCVCTCGGKNHGVANRAGMEPLDKALGLEKGAPAPLGDLALSRELSGLAEVEGEF